MNNPTTASPVTRSELDDLLHQDIMRVAEKCGALADYPNGKTFDAYIAFDWIAAHLEASQPKPQSDEGREIVCQHCGKRAQ